MKGEVYIFLEFSVRGGLNKIEQNYPVKCFSCESSSHASDMIEIHTGHNLGGQLFGTTSCLQT